MTLVFLASPFPEATHFSAVPLQGVKLGPFLLPGQAAFYHWAAFPAHHSLNCLVWDRVSCSLCWLQTHYITWGWPCTPDSSASTSWVLGFQAWAIMLQLILLVLSTVDESCTFLAFPRTERGSSYFVWAWLLLLGICLPWIIPIVYCIVCCLFSFDET